MEKRERTSAAMVMGVIHGLSDLHPQAPVADLDGTVGAFTEGADLDDDTAL
jgi:hypothetical protein